MLGVMLAIALLRGLEVRLIEVELRRHQKAFLAGLATLEWHDDLAVEQKIAQVLQMRLRVSNQRQTRGILKCAGGGLGALECEERLAKMRRLLAAMLHRLGGVVLAQARQALREPDVMPQVVALLGLEVVALVVECHVGEIHRDLQCRSDYVSAVGADDLPHHE